MNDTSSGDRIRRVEILASGAASVKVGFGAAIQVVSGHVWLTQEGDSRDYTLPAGVTFCTDRSGIAVLSAINAPSVVLVCECGARARHVAPGTVSIDSLERITRAAREMQAEHVAGVARRALRWLASIFRRKERAWSRPS